MSDSDRGVVMYDARTALLKRKLTVALLVLDQYLEEAHSQAIAVGNTDVADAADECLRILSDACRGKRAPHTAENWRPGDEILA